jgi:hypothetical protein
LDRSINTGGFDSVTEAPVPSPKQPIEMLKILISLSHMAPESACPVAETTDSHVMSVDLASEAVDIPATNSAQVVVRSVFGADAVDLVIEGAELSVVALDLVAAKAQLRDLMVQSMMEAGFDCYRG